MRGGAACPITWTVRCRWLRINLRERRQDAQTAKGKGPEPSNRVMKAETNGPRIMRILRINTDFLRLIRENPLIPCNPRPNQTLVVRERCARITESQQFREQSRTRAVFRDGCLSYRSFHPANVLPGLRRRHRSLWKERPD